VRFELQWEPLPDDIAALRAKLIEEASRETGAFDRKRMRINALDDGGAIAGSVYGWLDWGWLYVELLWVEPPQRRRGIATQLLQVIERTAREHGIDRARVATASFQRALPLYQKLGYTIYAQLPLRAPNGSAHVEYFLEKRLS
jgi:GNAT superfamily N-acetyltransferase